jgi:hypothetical protein
MARSRSIEVGQRYRALASVPGRWTPTWEVLEVFRSPIDRIDYARVCAVDDPARVKTIAVSALLDPRLHVEDTKVPHDQHHHHGDDAPGDER